MSDSYTNMRNAICGLHGCPVVEMHRHFDQPTQPPTIPILPPVLTSRYPSYSIDPRPYPAESRMYPPLLPSHLSYDRPQAYEYHSPTSAFSPQFQYGNVVKRKRLESLDMPGRRERIEDKEGMICLDGTWYRRVEGNTKGEDDRQIDTSAKQSDTARITDNTSRDLRNEEIIADQKAALERAQLQCKVLETKIKDTQEEHLKIVQYLSFRLAIQRNISPSINILLAQLLTNPSLALPLDRDVEKRTEIRNALTELARHLDTMPPVPIASFKFRPLLNRHLGGLQTWTQLSETASQLIAQRDRDNGPPQPDLSADEEVMFGILESLTATQPPRTTFSPAMFRLSVGRLHHYTCYKPAINGIHIVPPYKTSLIVDPIYTSPNRVPPKFLNMMLRATIIDKCTKGFTDYTKGDTTIGIAYVLLAGIPAVVFVVPRTKKIFVVDMTHQWDIKSMQTMFDPMYLRIAEELGLDEEESFDYVSVDVLGRRGVDLEAPNPYSGLDHNFVRALTYRLLSSVICHSIRALEGDQSWEPSLGDCQVRPIDTPEGQASVEDDIIRDTLSLLLG